MKKRLGYIFIFSGIALIPVLLWLMFEGKFPSELTEIFSFLITLVLFFSGFALIIYDAEPAKRKRKARLRLIISLTLVLLGLYMKFNHMYGAGITFINGVLMFCFSYVPLLVLSRYEKWKDFTSNKFHTITVSIADLLSIISVSYGVLGKAMHWPLAFHFLIFGAVLFGISFIAWNRIFRYSLQKSRESEIKLNETLKELKTKHEIIEEKNKEITDSINYAKRIQSALLPDENDLKKIFPDSFILFKPKDIVSGDFYWMAKTENHFFYVTADCTGHGVPGGFMSMLGSSFLNEIIVENKLREPAEILDRLREKVISALKQTGETGENKDGMDLVLIRVSNDLTKLSYASANNEFYIIRNNEMHFYYPDKQPIGFIGAHQKPFIQHEVQLMKGDVIYTFTDGYADQFGGDKGKKLKYKNMETLFMENHLKNFSGQKIIYENFIENWRGSLEQNDDICVIGIRI